MEGDLYDQSRSGEAALDPLSYPSLIQKAETLCRPLPTTFCVSLYVLGSPNLYG